MLIRTASSADPRPSEITSPVHYARRRQLLAMSGFAAATAAGWWPGGAAHAQFRSQAAIPPTRQQLADLPGAASPLSTTEKQTSWDDVTSYNNYYEFGVEKDEPARRSGTLITRPWTVAIEGAVAKPQTLDIDALLKLAPMEERVYRMRCVEGWSMVIPWVGYSLSALIRRLEPTGNAKYVEFTTLADPRQMPGLRASVLDWPYVEGLRMDEAMHPLTLLGFGLYGKVLPNQNGAPVRLVVPWKYGFKSIKSLVKIRFTETQPGTSWGRSGPSEYGFYSNVNPEVAHPRWSQATERRIGEDGFFTQKRPTLKFNGYGDQVGQLYAGMDLRRFY